MNAGLLFLLVAATGIQYGWQPSTKGGMEYIIQIDEEILQALKNGQSITSAIPPEVQDVRTIRIQFGNQPLPQINRASGVNASAPADPRGVRVANSLPPSMPDRTPLSQIGQPQNGSNQADPHANDGNQGGGATQGSGRTPLKPLTLHTPGTQPPLLQAPVQGDPSAPQHGSGGSFQAPGQTTDSSSTIPIVAPRNPGLDHVNTLQDPNPNRQINFPNATSQPGSQDMGNRQYDPLTRPPRVRQPGEHGLAQDPFAGQNQIASKSNHQETAHPGDLQQDHSAAQPETTVTPTGNPSPANNDTKTPSSQASTPLLITVLLLFMSIGGNIFLGMVASSVYRRYRSLARELRETIAAAA